MGVASDPPSPHGAAGVGRQPHLGNASCAPLALKALASAYDESVGHPFLLKHWPSTVITAASHPFVSKLPCNCKLDTLGMPFQTSTFGVWYLSEQSAGRNFLQFIANCVGSCYM